MPLSEELGRFKPFLLPLEFGCAVRLARTESQTLHLVTRTKPNNPNKEVDLVLLASATACLQEGPDEAAIEIAREVLLGDPGRQDLLKLVKPTQSSEDLRNRVGEYLIFAGYGPEPELSLAALGDIYFGRVVGATTHPMLGVACMSYFRSVSERYATIAPISSACARLWSKWVQAEGKQETIEQQALQLAQNWVATHHVS